MRKLALVLAIMTLVAFGLSAQSVPWADFQQGFDQFAADVANSLPATASIGANWSHAYIGQFPHFGVGLTAGGAFLPFATMQPVLTALGVTLPSQLDFLQKYGIPFPAAALDARIGGFGLPFDVGLKFGFIPQAAKNLLGSVSVDYLMAGADVRFAILKDRGFIPALSVGGGYTFLRGAVGVPDLMGTGNTDINLSSIYGGSTYILRVTAPEASFSWQTHTIMAKAQVSKNLLIFTPSLGVGAAYGRSSAGGGLSSSVQYSTDGTTFNTMTDAEIQNLKDQFVAAGLTPPEVSAQGILVSSAVNGWSFWAFGGVALNLLFIKVDVSGMYNLVSGSYGASANLRVQL